VLKINYVHKTYKSHIKTINPLFLTLALSTTALTTQAVEPTPIPTQKQVAGYYHHQIGNTQITAILDGTNYLNPSLFKGLSDSEKNINFKD
jgi:hypothetical protein